MSFLKRFVHKSSTSSLSSDTKESAVSTRAPAQSHPPSTAIAPARSGSLSTSASASTPPTLTSSTGAPGLHHRPSLISVPASLSLTAKVAAIPAQLLPNLQSSALPPSALSPTSKGAGSLHFAFQTPAASSGSVSSSPGATQGLSDDLHIHSVPAATGGHAGLPSPSASSSSSGHSSPSGSGAVVEPPVSSTTFTATTTATTTNTNTGSSGPTTTSPTDPSSALLFPITFCPAGGLPSMDPTRFNDLLTEGAGWTLEDRLVYYVHLASRIQGGQSEGWILEQVRPLCRKGVDINAHSSVMSGVTAITAAVYAGYLSVVRYLLSQGADVNLCTEEGLSCVMLAVYVDHMEILKEVLARRPSLEHVDAKQQNVLHIAVQRGLVWMVERMLPCRTSRALNTRNDDGATPLILAVKQGSLQLVQLLVGAGTDCTLRDNSGLSAFDLTLQLPANEQTELMRRILSPIPQLTLPYLSVASYCTFWATDRVPCVQPNFYRCLTCDRSGLQGICDACHSHCHVGHHMVPADASLRYYCGCGSGEHRGENGLCQSRPGQQYHTPQGEELDWPMGKLSDSAVRHVLLGLVFSLGLAGSVVIPSPRDPSAHRSRPASGSGLESVSSSRRESLTFHPQMQTLDAEGIAVEWSETWLIAFPVITIKILWRLQGATARLSAHQYSIVSEYLQTCNAELSELTNAANASEDSWDYGQMELAPATGEVSYVIPYNAAGDLITELSPLVEYNHTLAKKMFTRFCAPLVRLMTTGNEAALGLRSANASTAFAASGYQAAGAGNPAPPHHHSRIPQPRASNDGIASPADALRTQSSSPAPLVDTDADVDLSPEHLESLGFDVIDSVNLDLPVDPSLVRTGGGAVVIRGSTVSDGTPIAFKMVHHQDEMEYDVKLRREFLDEALLLKRCSHSRIVQFMGLCTRPYGLITELLDTSLYDVLYTERRLLKDVEVATIALEVCRGVAYLHARHPPIIHRDIKSHNILLNKHLSSTKICSHAHARATHNSSSCPHSLPVRLTSLLSRLSLPCPAVRFCALRCAAYICDLGIAKSKEQLRQQVERGEVDGLGSLAWMAPECLDLLHSFEYELLERIDVYSLGCVVYEMLFRRIPWSSADSPAFPPPAAEIIESLEVGKRPPVSLAELSARSSMPLIWQSLLDKCCSSEPAARPTVGELVQTFSRIVKVCEREAHGGARAASDSVSGSSSPSSTSSPVSSQQQPQQPPAPSSLSGSKSLTVAAGGVGITPRSPDSASVPSQTHSPLRTPIFHRDSPPGRTLRDPVSNPSDHLSVHEAVLYSDRGEDGSLASDDNGRLHFSPGTPSSGAREAPDTPDTALRVTP